MASAIPAKLKAAAPDVGRFATRAAQLEKFRPIVTYWCEYYILQQILNRQLHTTDEECTTYAMQLMDKLEAYKAENPAEDAVIDDVAAKAYIENFALETFNKADEAQRINKVTKQTADTFQASATFMDVLTIWAPLEQELASKSKFAKFHALRIVKAIKAGEDPNATNPVVERPPELDNAGEMSLEEELKKMEDEAGGYNAPTVHSVAGSAQPSRPQSTLATSPMAPPALPIKSPIQAPFAEPEVSPIEPAETDNSRAGSVGGGYFPAVPDDHSHVNAQGPLDQLSTASSTFAASDPADFYSSSQPVPSAPSPGASGPASPHRWPEHVVPHHATVETSSTSYSTPSAHVAAPPRIVNPAPPPPVVPINAGPPPGGYRDDDDSIMAAQKHAKWAISALNFEDVPTAVKELRIALQSLVAT